MFKIIAAAAAALIVATSPVAAQTYIQGSAGSVPYDNSSKSSYTVSLGRDFGKFRVDAGFAEAHDVKLYKHSTQNYNVNAYFEPITYKGLTPYVGAGLAHGSFDSKNAYAYNAIGGVSYDLTSHYTVFGQAVNTNSPSADYNENTYSLGLRYNF